MNLRLINAYELEKALDATPIRIAAEKGKMYQLIDNAPTVDILLYSVSLDAKTGDTSLVVKIGEEKYEITGPNVDMKVLARKMGISESDCGPGCAHYPTCVYNQGRHGIVRINCPLWRAKG